MQRRNLRMVFLWLGPAFGLLIALGLASRLSRRPPPIDTTRIERAMVSQTLVLRGRLQRRVEVDIRPSVAGWVVGRVPEIGQKVAKGDHLLTLRAQPQFVAQVEAALAQEREARQQLRHLSRVAVRSPVAGRLRHVEVAPGSRVEAGQALATVEIPASPSRPAEQYTVKAPVAGQVLPFLVGPGEEVGPGDDVPLLNLIPAADPEVGHAPAAADAMGRLLQANAELERLGLTASRRFPAPSLPADRVFVVAPLGGEVTWRALNLVSGSPVSATERVLALASAERIVLATVHEVDYPGLRTGQAVEVTFDAYPDKPLPASLVSKSQTPAASIYEQFSEYTAVFSLLDRAEDLVDGMSGNIVVTVESRPAVASLPLSALVRREGQNSVFVRNGTRFEPRSIRIGLVGDSRFEVLDGLGSDEQVAQKPERLPATAKAEKP